MQRWQEQSNKTYQVRFPCWNKLRHHMHLPTSNIGTQISCLWLSSLITLPVSPLHLYSTASYCLLSLWSLLQAFFKSLAGCIDAMSMEQCFVWCKMGSDYLTQCQIIHLWPWFSLDNYHASTKKRWWLKALSIQWPCQCMFPSYQMLKTIRLFSQGARCSLLWVESHVDF